MIRAAYRALMRRYHPDADPSSEASQRAQAINAAYAVLSDPDKRARYDGSLAAQGLIKPDAPHRLSLARRMMPGPAGLSGPAGLAGALPGETQRLPLAKLPYRSICRPAPRDQRHHGTGRATLGTQFQERAVWTACRTSGKTRAPIFAE